MWTLAHPPACLGRREHPCAWSNRRSPKTIPMPNLACSLCCPRRNRNGLLAVQGRTPHRSPSIPGLCCPNWRTGSLWALTGNASWHVSKAVRLDPNAYPDRCASCVYRPSRSLLNPMPLHTPPSRPTPACCAVRLRLLLPIPHLSSYPYMFTRTDFGLGLGGVWSRQSAPVSCGRPLLAQLTCAHSVLRAAPVLTDSAS